jgi:hypothetical protein
MIEHIEFWNPVKFKTYMDGHGKSYEEVAAEVMLAE